MKVTMNCEKVNVGASQFITSNCHDTTVVLGLKHSRYAGIGLVGYLVL